jgi:hypothetical protein
MQSARRKPQSQIHQTQERIPFRWRLCIPSCDLFPSHPQTPTSNVTTHSGLLTDSFVSAPHSFTLPPTAKHESPVLIDSATLSLSAGPSLSSAVWDAFLFNQLYLRAVHSVLMMPVWWPSLDLREGVLHEFVVHPHWCFFACHLQDLLDKLLMLDCWFCFSFSLLWSQPTCRWRSSRLAILPSPSQIPRRKDRIWGFLRCRITLLHRTRSETWGLTPSSR